MKKLLSILGTLGLVSTSATAVVSFTEITKDNNSEVETENGIQKELNALIEEAKELVKQPNKGVEAYQALHNAIGAANGTLDIYKNEDDHIGVLAIAKTTLQDAINVFENIKAKNADKKLLDERIKDAKEHLAKPTNNNKLDQAKTDFEEAIEDANNIFKATHMLSEQKEVDNAVLVLQKAMVDFLKATNERADYKELDAAIIKATNSHKDKNKDKNDAANKSILEAIKTAEAVVRENHTTGKQDIVNKATQALLDAIAKYEKAGLPPLNPENEEGVDLKALIAKIKEANNVANADAVVPNHKTEANRIIFQTAIGHAQGIVDGKPVKGQEEAIKAETNKLDAAIKAFTGSDNAKANIDMLKANITAAKAIKDTNKTPKAIKTFNDAIAAAEKVLGSETEVNKQPDIDKQVEVNTAANAMWKATVDFLSSVERTDIRHEIANNTLLSAPLENIEEATIKAQLEKDFKEFASYTIGNAEQTTKGEKYHVVLTGTGDYSDTTIVKFVLKIDYIKDQLTKIVNDKKDQLWTVSDLQAAINDAGLDRTNGLIVKEMPNDGTVEGKNFRISANKSFDYSSFSGDLIISQKLEK
ncbi:hypothetical protein ELUMI_v1c00750 [Williamsoniiplasma luminosum]|uniref:Uncharacterized protein n=1 Tax=Williamsoniiplasma luminosum TaxID=214888 RepID=A0A2K8NVY8_9MOLU|nr:lipoprotein [Williamsoniiplasma luminosum]ATZ16803.1 hypothetical protein ELUMI_v1c00750 [Williamsoniiplasma luminosum]